ncbi:DNA polymerase-4 [Desulfobaculum xiamenense]|uniref:DNA polymerase IV n=2 Tax=Desulfobaculum xiamenense TaxID=995050 RepID=A0A846QPC7_9BACT|nr:DNA polymerase-4 [Desulfobaculum xiamenense]
MDAFFASVEQADDPSLKGKPVIIGGSHRGVVSTASYEARVFGVHSAMPSATARRLCPHGVFLPGRMRRYREVSGIVMDILRTTSPLVEQVSVDEAYIDATGTDRLFGPPQALAAHIKSEIVAATGLTCSVGIAPNRFLSKIASDMNKPNGVFSIAEDEVAAFLATLPVRKIPGIGPRTQETLKLYGVTVVGDILKRSAEFWVQRLGRMGALLHERASGVDDTPIVPYHEPKSSSAENTLDEDTTDREVLRRWLFVQAERVGADLRRHGYRGRTVTLKLKYADFTACTRSRTLPDCTDVTGVIFDTACELLDAEALRKRVRLIGVGVSNFNQPQRQLSLFEMPAQSAGGAPRAVDAKPRGAELDRAMDAIRQRFGRDAVQRGLVFGFDGDD